MPITNLTKETLLANSVEIANTPFKRMRGLLGRTSMKAQEALIITECNSIHMFFMKFTIDVVFLNKENKVIGLSKRIKPFECSPIFWRAVCAVELPEGTIEATNTQVGDRLAVSA
ncbi:MAG: DUF192 domain-containing protein [Candidatus Omnitrophota bacterium]